MMFRPATLSDRWIPSRFAALIVPGLFAAGCINLSEPANVRTYCPSGSAATCTDDFEPPSPDAKMEQDVWSEPVPDTRPASDPFVPPPPDAGPDTPQGQPDVYVESKDALVDTRDALGPEAKDTAASEATRPDTQTPVDLPQDKPIGPDVEPDTRVGEDTPPDIALGPDTAPDTFVNRDTPPPLNCKVFFGNNPGEGGSGHPAAANTKEAFCIVTCDPVAGWGCSNFEGRTVTVNSAAATCGATLTAKDGYYVFRVSAGTNTSAALYWWVTTNWATSCPTPASGVYP